MHPLGTAQGLSAFFALFDQKISRSEASSLLGRPLTATETGFFSLHPTPNEMLQRYERRAKFWGGLLGFFPFVRGVAVVNTVAMRTPDEKSDIDLFIIIKSGRLWLSRLMITIFLHLFGVRRHGKKIAGRLCLSFFATEEALEMEKIALPSDDPYLALWTATIHPIFGYDAFARFTAKNEEFLAHYGLHFWNRLPQKEPLKRALQWLLELPFRGFFGNFLERKLRSFLLPRAQKKASALTDASGIILSDSMLKFHNTDRREAFALRWQLGLKSGMR